MLTRFARHSSPLQNPTCREARIASRVPLCA
jgi:hypothetical protein